MKIVLVVSWIISLTFLCSNASAITFGCPTGPVAVTSDVSFDCGGNSFDFGANPLPLGGAVTLKSLTASLNGYPSWYLNFGFPSPAVGRIELDYSVVAYFPSNTLNGATKFALGMSPDPFNVYNFPNESGTNFQISETVGGPTALTINSIENVYAYVADGQTAYSFDVETDITDNAGDLTGFDEAFAVPEPDSWALLAGGLLALCGLSRNLRRGRCRVNRSARLDVGGRRRFF